MSKRRPRHLRPVRSENSTLSINQFRFEPSRIQRARASDGRLSTVCDFGVQVVERVCMHTAEGTRTKFVLALRHHGREHGRLAVGSDDLSNGKKLQASFTECAPHLCIGANQAEPLRAAIQSLLQHMVAHGNLTTRIGSEMTGWVTSDGGATYVGVDTSTGVDPICFEGATAGYLQRLETTSSDTSLRDDVETILRGPPGIHRPELREVYRAAVFAPPLIRRISDGRGCSFVFNGVTGTGKTAMGKSITRCFGATDGTSWTSTVNDIERRIGVVGDAPILIDDYRPANVDARTFKRIVQNSADGSARGRMGPDFRGGVTYLPRAVPIITSEDLPSNDIALMGRAIVAEFRRGDVDGGVLAFADAYVEAAHRVVVAYLDWIAPHFNDVVADAKARARTEQQRIHDAVKVSHPRSAEVGAILIASYACFVRFLAERFGVDGQAIEGVMTCAIDSVLGGMTALVEDNAPGRSFLLDLRAAVDLGEVSLGGLAGTGPRVGYIHVEEGTVYLNFNAAYRALKRTKTMLWSQRAVRAALFSEGLLVCVSNPSELSVVVRPPGLAGKQARRLAIRQAAMFPESANMTVKS